MILGIDTSAGQCATALVAGDRVWRRTEPMTRGHAEALMPMIEAILGDAGAAYRDLARIGVVTGPGSFTGIRIGVAAARGLALGLGIPAIGITRFEALAFGRPGPLSVAVRGPSDQRFVQDFDAGGRPAGPPRIEPGAAEDALADPVAVARLAGDRAPGQRPAPLYLRDAAADPPREAPPPRLD